MSSTNLATDPATRVIRLDGSRTQVRGAIRHVTISVPDDFIVALLDSCDGTRTRSRVIDLLSGRFDVQKVAKALAALIDIGAIIEGQAPQYSDAYEALIAARRRRGLSIHAAEGGQRAIAETKIAQFGQGELCDRLQDLISKMGGQPAKYDNARASRPDIVIAALDAPNHELFRSLNRALISDNITALYGWLSDGRIVIGPLVEPAASPCFECYHHRARSHIKHLDEFDAYTNATDNRLAVSSPNCLAAAWAASMLGAVLTNWVHGTLMTHSPGQILEVDTFTLGTERHRLLKLPRCPVCGSQRDNRPPAPVYEFDV